MGTTSFFPQAEGENAPHAFWNLFVIALLLSPSFSFIAEAQEQPAAGISFPDGSLPSSSEATPQEGALPDSVNAGNATAGNVTVEQPVRTAVTCSLSSLTDIEKQKFKDAVSKQGLVGEELGPNLDGKKVSEADLLDRNKMILVDRDGEQALEVEIPNRKI